MHFRQQIRERVKEILEAIPVFTDRCHINRVRTLSKAEMPAVCIYTRRTSGERQIDQWRDKVTCNLEIELHAMGVDAEAMAADIDTLCLWVQTELFKDQTLGDICEDIEHKGDEIETDAESADVSIHARMTFEVVVVFENTATADDFQLVDVIWDPAPKDGVVAAEDQLLLAGVASS